MLDNISIPIDEYGIFTTEQLAILIKYHEQSANNGGFLGQDATRVILGALSLDSRRIGGEVAFLSRADPKETDIEKAEEVVISGIIVDWVGVRTVNINDRTDRAFLDKIKDWSYSRIPVLGDIGADKTETRPCRSDIEIFGYIHVKVRKSHPLNCTTIESAVDG